MNVADQKRLLHRYFPVDFVRLFSYRPTTAAINRIFVQVCLKSPTMSSGKYQLSSFLERIAAGVEDIILK